MATKEQENAFIEASRKRAKELIKKQRFSGLDILAKELNEDEKEEDKPNDEKNIEVAEPAVTKNDDKNVEVGEKVVEKTTETEEKSEEEKTNDNNISEQEVTKTEAIKEDVDSTEKEEVKNDVQEDDNDGQGKDIKNIQLKRFAKYFTENGIDGSVRRSCSIDKSINFVLGIIAKQEGTTIKLFSDNIISDWYVYNKEWFETNGCGEMFDVDASFDTITKPCKKSLFAPKKIKTNFSDTTIISLSLNDAKKTQMLSMMTGVPIYQLFDTMVMDWVKRYKEILERKTYWPLIKMKIDFEK